MIKKVSAFSRVRMIYVHHPPNFILITRRFSIPNALATTWDAMATFSTERDTARASGVAGYWQARMNAVLDTLEREARRMLQLEHELNAFANRYYEAVGDVAHRLAQLEMTIASVAEDVTTVMPVVMAQREEAPERSVELKTRYRLLAKEVHPDRAMVVEGTGGRANVMHALNAAYQQGDLAAMLRLEAEMHLVRLLPDATRDTAELETALREVSRAAMTYGDSYRAMLGSPLHELMLRAMSARLAGWDWIEAVVRKAERAIEEKERKLAQASIAKITAWRDSVESVA